MTVAWSFIETLEGSSLNGYVPKDKDGNPIGRSGVTVGMGVDLGQLSSNDLHAWPIASGLLAKLRPYLGIRGTFAVKVLAQFPLALTSAETGSINAIVQAQHEKRLRDQYNAVVLPLHLNGFDNLRLAAATVIMSVGWQYGDLPSRCPRFWKVATLQQWPAVVFELRSFGDEHPTRRKAEADYLEQNLRGK